MKNSLFDNDTYRNLLEQEIFKYLMTVNLNIPNVSESPRAAGDMIEGVIGSSFLQILSNAKIECSDLKTYYPRKAMAVLSFVSDNNHYYVDVTSHRVDTDFNMPNLTSVKRLSKLYENPNNYFVICFVTYDIHNIKAVSVMPIEFLSWNCLRIGALGEGQIQIANSNYVNIKKCSRQQWMLQLCNRLINDFYPNEIRKIEEERIPYFEGEKSFWEKNKSYYIP